MFFTKYNASKRNTSFLCFFMFFRANISQVKLDKVSFLFNRVTLIIRRSSSFSSIYKILKETKVNTRNIGSNHPEVFCKIGFMTLELKSKCFKNIETVA